MWLENQSLWERLNFFRVWIKRRGGGGEGNHFLHFPDYGLVWSYSLSVRDLLFVCQSEWVIFKDCGHFLQIIFFIHCFLSCIHTFLFIHLSYSLLSFLYSYFSLYSSFLFILFFPVFILVSTFFLNPTLKKILLRKKCCFKNA